MSGRGATTTDHGRLPWRTRDAGTSLSGKANRRSRSELGSDPLAGHEQAPAPARPRPVPRARLRFVGSGLGAVLLGLCLAAGPSAAQTPAGIDPAAKARIDRLYEEAVAALNAGNVDTACPKLEEVTRLAPEGVGARITLAECYEAAGKLASAWREYVAAEAMATNAGQDARVKKAAARAAELKPRLATLTISVPDVVHKTQGLVISRDGAPMVEAQWWTPLPVDKGPHTVVVSAPGRKTWTGKVDVAKDGDKMSLSVPPLEAEPGGPASSASSSATAPLPAADSPRSRIPAFVLGGVGVAGLIAGGALVGVAVSKGGELRDASPKGTDGLPLCGRTPATGEDPACAGLRSDAASSATLGNVGIGVLAGGGVLIAGAVVYLLLPGNKPAPASSSSKVVPVVGSGGGGLVWTGSF